MIGTGTRDGTVIAPGQMPGSTTVQSGIGNLPPHAHPLPEVSAVPEPASWAMMILGPGAVGGTLPPASRQGDDDRRIRRLNTPHDLTTPPVQGEGPVASSFDRAFARWSIDLAISDELAPRAVCIHS